MLIRDTEEEGQRNVSFHVERDCPWSPSTKDELVVCCVYSMRASQSRGSFLSASLCNTFNKIDCSSLVVLYHIQKSKYIYLNQKYCNTYLVTLNHKGPCCFPYGCHCSIQALISKQSLSTQSITIRAVIALQAKALYRHQRAITDVSSATSRLGSLHSQWSCGAKMLRIIISIASAI